MLKVVLKITFVSNACKGSGLCCWHACQLSCTRERGLVHHAPLPPTRGRRPDTIKFAVMAKMAD